MLKIRLTRKKRNKMKAEILTLKLTKGKKYTITKKNLFGWDKVEVSEV